MNEEISSVVDILVLDSTKELLKNFLNDFKKIISGIKLEKCPETGFCYSKEIRQFVISSNEINSLINIFLDKLSTSDNRDKIKKFWIDVITDSFVVLYLSLTSNKDKEDPIFNSCGEVTWISRKSNRLRLIELLSKSFYRLITQNKNE